MNRRNLLKAGALSSLCSLVNIHAQSPAAKKVNPQKNLVIITNEFGYFADMFNPKTEDLESSPLVSHLKPHFSDLTVFKEISQPEIGHGHERHEGLLTLNNRQTNGPYISLDQFAASHLLQTARFKTINMGENIVWDKNSRKVSSYVKEGPQKIYKKLFTRQSSSKTLKEKLSLLQSYNNNLPKNSYKMDSSFKQAIKELEEEIATDILWEEKAIPKVKIDTELHLADIHNRGYLTPFEQHLELIHLGLKHKRGQIFVASPPYIDKTSLGVAGSYHSYGHQASQKNPAQITYDHLLKIDSYIFKGFSSFLASMKKSNILKDTIVLFMGSFSNPGRHSRENTPTIIAGGGFKHQGLIQCKDQYQLSQLYVSILHQMGIDVNEFSTLKGNMDKVLT